MQIKVQIVKISDDGKETRHEVSCFERAELTSETLGLPLAEGKNILKSIQEVGLVTGKLS
jgi:hypothetical protein